MNMGCDIAPSSINVFLSGLHPFSFTVVYLPCTATRKTLKLKWPTEVQFLKKKKEFLYVDATIGDIYTWVG